MDQINALAARVAVLEEANAALRQRVADLEQIPGHGPELQAIRAARELADPEAQAARAVEQARDEVRRGALAYLAHAETAVRFASGALRPVVEAGKAGKLLMQSDAEPLRRALPDLERRVERVRELAAQEPWPEADERLQARNQGEVLLADARAVLAEFDAEFDRREAARRPRAPVG